jgi:hypothetical protein
MGGCMNNQYGNTSSYAAWRNEAGPGVVAFGMWLRVGFIGASAVAVGLIQLFSGEVKPLSALALTAGGLLLALFCWRRARNAFGVQDDAAVSVNTGAASPARVAIS